MKFEKGFINRTKRFLLSRFTPKDKSRTLEAGYSLLEILVALAIIASLTALVGPRLLGFVDDAKVTTTQTQIKNLKSSLAVYKLKTGRLPTKSEGLKVLLEPLSNGESILDSDTLPLDGWGNEFQYNPPAAQAGKSRTPQVYSLGADNEPGGTGLDTDIYG